MTRLAGVALLLGSLVAAEATGTPGKPAPTQPTARPIAVRNVETGHRQDPEFLESIRDQPTLVAVGEGETKLQNLKVTKQ